MDHFNQQARGTLGRDVPNYGANASAGTLNECAVRPPAPTISSNADMTNELHNRLSHLEEELNSVHQRIGAEHGPMQGRSPEKLTEGNGPLDFTAEQLIYALVRIDNLRTLVGTISARI